MMIANDYDDEDDEDDDDKNDKNTSSWISKPISRHFL